MFQGVPQRPEMLVGIAILRRKRFGEKGVVSCISTLRSRSIRIAKPRGAICLREVREDSLISPRLFLGAFSRQADSNLGYHF